MVKLNFLVVFLCLITFEMFGQIEIIGSVTDNIGNLLPDADIIEKGTTNGTTTDFDGNFKLVVSNGATIIISYVGFESQEIEITSSINLEVKLNPDNSLKEIVLVGSRSPKRTVIDSPVAVDIIDIAEVTSKTGKVEITELLQFAAPSFNAQKQSGADGADHITPATLRGLGPDQTLVLINGKRRHQSSLVNLFGTRGRGNTGTDLNAIPASSIKRIEVLRDGASAQYGSDAIAGVINIVLKTSVDKLTGEVFYGASDANDNGGFGIPAKEGLDGNTYKATANYGVAVGKKGGFINMTGEFLKKEKTFRPGADFRSKFGEASIDAFHGFFNSELPVSEQATFYAFGGATVKDTDAFAFDRDANDNRNVLAIYPNGFTPRIASIIRDRSISAGIKSKFRGWDVDFNNTYGINEFHYFIKGSLNASLLEASPTEFNAGGHSLSQNTTGIDFTRNFEVLSGLNIAFGGEYRIENFIIFAGEEASYTQYDLRGFPLTTATPVDDRPSEAQSRPGGSQGFPGYSPANEVDQFRTNLSAYIDGELDVSDTFLIALAGRFEYYSDFGSTFTGKISSRLKLLPSLNMRGSLSTGFRAPSLVQLFYNLRFSDFEAGELTETLLSQNASPVTQSFGIGALKEEKSTSASVGFSYSGNGFTASIDGYYTKVDDRIVLTGSFDEGSGLDPNLGVAAARFFANGVDTEVLGLDFVVTYNKRFDEHRFGANLIGNFNKLNITEINTGEIAESNIDTFFGEGEQAFLKFSSPEYKISLGVDYAYSKFSANVVTTRFGNVGPFVSNDDSSLRNRYGNTSTTDISVAYNITENIKITLGSNNIFNQYPDEQDPNGTESFGNYDAVQQGFGGAFYYTRLSYSF